MIKRGRWSSSISVDVDLDDVFIAMDERDRENMAKWLFDEGYLEEYIEKERARKLTSTVNGWDWEDTCDKLVNNQLRLTNEEEEIIKKIADRL
jgi:hypothetical protein